MKRKRRILSLLLSGAMLFSLCTPTVFAETLPQYSGQSVTEAGGLCEHHPEHNADCGYTEGTAGTPCGYVCELCGAGDNTPSNAKAVTVASVQAMIDALPNAEEITEDNAEEVKAQLDAIDEAKEKLSDEEIDELDMTRYAEAAAALGALAAPMLLADDSPNEQFSLTPGGRYYFDLSGEKIPGTANGNLPDSALHYVPFTYAGTIEAYKLTSETVTTEEYAKQHKYPHSLFVADYAVTNDVSWDTLNTANLIFGKNYASGGVDYTLRAPSVGSGYTGSDDSERGTPQSNEWDAILDKANQDWKDNTSGYIKNWSGKYSFGQDNYANAYRAYRGYFSARFWGWASASTRHPDLGFRPVLEVLNPDTLDSDGLKVVTLDLGGGTLGGSSDAIHIIVKTGSEFTAPASDGMTRPAGDTGSYFMWLDSNGNSYAPGASVPADVTELTVQWTAPTYTVTLNAGNGTINSGNVTGYTYGVGATLPTAGDMTYTGHTFKGWYDNENLTGSPVTAIGGTETGDKEYWARWEVNTYTITVKPENGEADITITQNYGTPITAPTLTREGYQFNGWDKAFPATMPAEDMTVTAQWKDSEKPTGEIKAETATPQPTVTPQPTQTAQPQPTVQPVSPIPSTGDTANPALWFALLFVSGSALAAIFVLRRKANRK